MVYNTSMGEMHLVCASAVARDRYVVSKDEHYIGIYVKSCFVLPFCPYCHFDTCWKCKYSMKRDKYVLKLIF